MFSIYTSAFFIEKMRFDYNLSLSNFCKFVGNNGEVIISVPRLPNDNTFELLLNWRKQNNINNLSIYLCNFTPEDPQFDGKVKNHALLNCNSENVMIQMDLDEIIPLYQKNKWIEYSNFLKSQNDFDAFMIPIVEPYGDILKIKKDHGVKLKWRMHLCGLNRGVVSFAKKEDGIHHDIKLSDSTELINPNGELVKSYKIINNESYLSIENYLNYLKNNIYTVHLGYLSFDDRILRNNLFWEKMWSTECGETVSLPKEKEELEKFSVINHNLFDDLKQLLS